MSFIAAPIIIEAGAAIGISGTVMSYIGYGSIGWATLQTALNWKNLKTGAEKFEAAGSLIAAVVGRWYGSKLAQGGKPATCFTAETLVATSEGLKEIQSIRRGESVWSSDRQGNWSLSEVIRELEHSYDGPLYRISFGAESVEATSTHPFWVIAGENLADRPAPSHVPTEEDWSAIEGRWVDAEDLVDGDRLRMRNGEDLSIDTITSRVGQLQVFNLEVSGGHSYTVGRSGVLVHNKAEEVLPEKPSVPVAVPSAVGETPPLPVETAPPAGTGRPPRTTSEYNPPAPGDADYIPEGPPKTPAPGEPTPEVTQAPLSKVGGTQRR